MTQHDQSDQGDGRRGRQDPVGRAEQRPHVPVDAPLHDFGGQRVVGETQLGSHLAGGGVDRDLVQVGGRGLPDLLDQVGSPGPLARRPQPSWASLD